MSMDHRQRPGDARVELDRGEHVDLRVYVSPLWTVLGSVFEVLLGWRRGVPDDWIRFVKDRVGELDLSPFQVFDLEDRTIPNFFLPVPPRAVSTLDEELEALKNTPPKRVRSDLRAEFGRRVPKELRVYDVDPEVALGTFGAAVARYWDAVFKPVWPRMRAVLEREVVISGKVLTTDGATAALSRIHPSFWIKDGVLGFEASRPGHVSTSIENRRIVLIPMVAGAEANITSVDRSDVVVLAYAAPGSSAVWHTATSSPTETALTRVLGETRERIVVALNEPATTTLLARQLGLAPATVSHHLSALTDQGIVEATRIGNAVYYDITDRGRSLLEIFSS